MRQWATLRSLGFCTPCSTFSVSAAISRSRPKLRRSPRRTDRHMRPSTRRPVKGMRNRCLQVRSQRRRRFLSAQRRSLPNQSMGPSFRVHLLQHRPKPQEKFLHTNGPPLTGSKRVPRRKARRLFTTRLRSLTGRLSQASSRHRRLLPRRLQASCRPRMCLRQSARRESPAHQAEVQLDGAKGASPKGSSAGFRSWLAGTVQPARCYLSAAKPLLDESLQKGNVR